LYGCRSPARVEELKQIAVVKTNSNGKFDFGAVPLGHYSLRVGVDGSDVMGGWFDVEITDKVKPTENILLDVSPIHPDCTGGPEFIERKGNNATSN
jgi:hypothetical protein